MKVQGELVIYTDGACSQGIGGFGSVIVNAATEQHVSLGDGPFQDTTNNQMEMMAAIAGLRFVKERLGPRPLLIISDSKYVINGITDWIHNWKRNRWTKADGMPVKNKELWIMMEKEREFHPLTRFEWVKGHAGNRFNELADEIAVNARTANETYKTLRIET